MLLLKMSLTDGFLQPVDGAASAFHVVTLRVEGPKGLGLWGPAPLGYLVRRFESVARTVVLAAWIERDATGPRDIGIKIKARVRGAGPLIRLVRGFMGVSVTRTPSPPPIQSVS